MTLEGIREHYKTIVANEPKGSAKREASYTIYIRLLRYTNRVDATTGISRIMLVGKPEHMKYYAEALARLRGEL